MLSLIGRVGIIIIATMFRNRNMALLILLSLHETHVLAMALSFFGMNGSVSTVVSQVCSSCYLAFWHYYLLTLSLILTAIKTILHLPFLNCPIISGEAILFEGLIGYYGGNFCASSSFEHRLADANGLLLESVLRSLSCGHVRACFIVHLDGIILRIITSEIRLSVCKLLVAIHIWILII